MTAFAGALFAVKHVGTRNFVFARPHQGQLYLILNIFYMKGAATRLTSLQRLNDLSGQTLIAAELDYHLFRIPYLGPILIGARLGWVEWTGRARAADGNTNVGDTGLSLVPITALVGWRIDGLARHLHFPLIFTPKFGLDMGYYQTGTSGVTQQDGWSVGLMYGAQIALELDFLDVRAAQHLDEEWGINHTEVFFELFGSTMGSFTDRQLPLGSGLAWAAGLGFNF